MPLFRPSKPLRGRFLRIFGPSRPLKPRFSLERVVVFEVFAFFSSHSPLSLSLASFRPFFGFSGHLPASSREAFCWADGEGENSGPLPFDRTCVQVPFPPPKWCLPSSKTTPKPPQILPKMRPKSSKLGAHRATFHSHSSFLLLYYLVLLTTYYILSTKHVNSLRTLLLQVT